MESKAIKELKHKHPAYASYYYGAQNLIAAQKGMYGFRSYSGEWGDFVFSSIKAWRTRVK